jgi:hypothetical protein
MDPNPQLATANVNLAHPHAYIATFMVNRFCLIKNSGFTVGHFGLIDDSGKLLDKFGCIFTDASLKELRENLVSYSAKIGMAKTKKPAWKPKVEDAEDRRSEVSMAQYPVYAGQSHHHSPGHRIRSGGDQRHLQPLRAAFHLHVSGRAGTTRRPAAMVQASRRQATSQTSPARCA